MTAYRTDLTEEGRAFLQQRVALFAKVMIGAQALGLAGLLALNPWEQLRQPWFARYQVQTGLAVGAWFRWWKRHGESLRSVSDADDGRAKTIAVDLARNVSSLRT